MRRFGRVDLTVTDMGFGAAPIGNFLRPITEDVSAAMVQRAWDHGMRYFDTAPYYGHGLSEARLGHSLRWMPREDYVISSKVGRVLKPAARGSINLNYYDDKALEQAVTPFVEDWLRTLVACGMRTDVVLCIGTGKNAAYFTKLNERLGLFDRIIALEHPRYIMQYKTKELEQYIGKYVAALEEVGK